MKKNSNKGASTQTGMRFETKSVSFLKKELLSKFQFKIDESNKQHIEFLRGDGSSFYLTAKHDFYSHLEKKDPFCKKSVSSILLPDSAIIFEDYSKVIVFEIKNQEVQGSVDEKLQTCDFKKKQYLKILKKISPLKLSFEYVYLLSNWFKKAKYQDTLQYIKDSGCSFYFMEDPGLITFLEELINSD